MNALPERVARLAISSRDLPAGSVGWTRADLVRVLEALHGSVVAIVSANAFRPMSWGYAPVDVVWTSIPYLPGELAAEYAARSRAALTSFLEAYSHHDHVFVIEISSQSHEAAGEGSGGEPVRPA